MKRKYLSIILSLALIFSCFGFTPYGLFDDGYAYAAENDAPYESGNTKVHFAMQENGTYAVTVEAISGSDGRMADHTGNREAAIPWYKLMGQISSIKVEEGVTYIGEQAFYDNTATKIEIAVSVESIGKNAFYNSYIVRLLEEAKKLSIPQQEIIRMIEEGPADEKRD